MRQSRMTDVSPKASVDDHSVGPGFGPKCTGDAGDQNVPKTLMLFATAIGLMSFALTESLDPSPP
jgi:hypothetical protein